MSPRLLVVPDGAADAFPPTPAGRTCLEEARTPNLDRLAVTGELRRVRTIPPGLLPGTEVGLPGLLGARVDRAPSRGRIEAAAAGVALGPGEGAWRLDLVPPVETDRELTAQLVAALAPLGARVHPLSGHRLLLVGPGVWGDAPAGPHHGARWPGEQVGPFAAVARAGAAVRPDQRPWPWGALGTAHDLPDLHHGQATVVTAGGAAAGIAAAMGATVVRAAGGDAWEAVVDLLHAATGSGRLVVLHLADPDEAAHARDRGAKVAALENLDAGLGAHRALVDRVQLVVCPDHGCDPATGRHTGQPVPALVRPGTDQAGGSGARLTERAVQGLPEQSADELLVSLSQVQGAVA